MHGVISGGKEEKLKPLHAAARAGDVQKVAQLLKVGAKKDVQDARGWTALMHACFCGHAVMAKELLSRGVSMRSSDYLGRTALFLAAELGHDSVVHEILTAAALPADVDVEGEKGRGVDHDKLVLDQVDLQGHTALYAAASAGHVLVVVQLLKVGADSEVTDTVGLTPLYAACAGRRLAAVRAMVDSGLVDTSMKPVDGIMSLYALSLASLLAARRFAQLDTALDAGTSLLVAAAAGRADVVKALCADSPPDLMHAARSDGTTPLIAAAGGGFWDVVEVLLEEGADCDICRADGTSPMMAAVVNGHVHVVAGLLRTGANPNLARRGDRCRPLHIACRKGYLGTATELLRCGADIDAVDHLGNNSFLETVGGGHEELMHVLIDWGADVTVASSNGTTALNAACKDDRPRVALRLIGMGTDVNQRDIEGQSPIYSASMHGQVALVSRLVEAGGDPTIGRYDGKTPLMAAAARGHHGVVKFLLMLRVPLEAEDSEGRTALYLATDNGHSGCGESLVVAAASVQRAFFAIKSKAEDWGREERSWRKTTTRTATKQRGSC